MCSIASYGYFALYVFPSFLLVKANFCSANVLQPANQQRERYTIHLAIC